MNVKIKKYIAKQNKTFLKASDANKRVIIAKDVIKHVLSKKFIPSVGNYLRINLNNTIDYSDQKHYLLLDTVQSEVLGKELQEIIGKKTTTCKVCALGSCFLSLVNLEDNYKLSIKKIDNLSENPDITQSEMHEKLGKYFDKRDLSLIEATFEYKNLPFYVRKQLTDLEVNNAAKFGAKYKTESGLLVGIMKNIIKNKGNFKP